MGPEVRQLRYFVAVAEERNFTRAAERLHLAQQSLSHAIAQLENQVGLKLLERDPRRVELTPDGEFLYRRALELVGRADELGLALRERADGTRQQLVVGLLDHAAAELTAPIMEAFRLAVPGCRVRLVSTGWTPNELVAKGHVDVAFVAPPYGDERIATTPLFHEPRVLDVPLNHELADASAVSLTDLAGQRWVRFGPEVAPAWADCWNLRDERNGEHAESAVSCLPSDPRHALLDLFLQQSVGTSPASFARAHPSESVRFVPIADLPLEATSQSLATRRGATSTLARRFVEIAQQTTRELIGLVPGAVLPDQTATTAVPVAAAE